MAEISGRVDVDESGFGGADIGAISLADGSTEFVTGTSASDGTYTLTVDGGSDYLVLCQLVDGDGNQQQLYSYRTFVESSIPTYIQNKGVLWIPFDEGSGSTAADALENGHNADITGAIWTSGTWVGDTTLEYDANDDVAVVQHDTTLNVANADFAIAATVNLNDPSTTDNWIGVANKYILGSTDTESFGLFHNSGSWNMRIRDPNSNDINPSTPIDSNQMPARLVGVRRGDTGYLYVNGTQMDSHTNSIGDPSNSRNFNIGRYYTTRAIDGIVDDVILFHDALTDSEIADDYTRQPWS